MFLAIKSCNDSLQTLDGDDKTLKKEKKFYYIFLVLQSCSFNIILANYIFIIIRCSQ